MEPDFVYKIGIVNGEEVYLREYWYNSLTGERFTLEDAAKSEGETTEDFLRKFNKGFKPYFFHEKETEEDYLEEEEF